MMDAGWVGRMKEEEEEGDVERATGFNAIELIEFKCVR